MPRTTEIVINASPTVALVAALGDLRVLQMYRTVWVPFEVCAEITTGGAVQFAVAEFEAAHWLHKIETPVTLSPALVNTLDVGEAAVIQLALDRHIQTVCIDETVGRRTARLHGPICDGFNWRSVARQRRRVFLLDAFCDPAHASQGYLA